MRVTIIVPVFNEAAILRSFVTHLREHAPEEELVIVDGGSSDGSWELLQELAQPFRLRVIQGARGRASQMNAGAAVAIGDVFWFLHVDSELPSGCIETIQCTLQASECVGGCFRLRFASAQSVYRISDSLGNIAVDIFRIALGDHGIFCRRKIFDRVGGYREIPLMEDARFYQDIQRHGCVKQTRPTITTSSRLYERYGPARTTFYYIAILALYVVGAPLGLQYRIYRHLTRSSKLRMKPAIREHGSIISSDSL